MPSKTFKSGFSLIASGLWEGVKSKVRLPRNKALSDEILSKSFFPLGDFVNFLVSYDQQDLAAYASIALFNKTAPFNNAVTILSDEIASLKIVLWDKKKEQYITRHAVLDLLNEPNPGGDGVSFLKQVAAFYLITGNSYIVATGNVERPPVELEVSYPTQIQIQGNTRDCYADTITDMRSYAVIFKRSKNKKGRFRFYYESEGEIWHIKGFNPNVGAMTGQSSASSIFAEIDQYNQSSIHNSSLLKRGGRPSGILIANSLIGKDGKEFAPITQEQRESLKAQINKFIAGVYNAGQIMVATGRNLKWENLITNNRDMDFMEGRRDNRNVIYNKYKVPLPFVSPERQTFANMEVARTQLYHNAVLPLAKPLFGELTNFLIPRYGKGSENLQITYDESAIAALRKEKVKEIEGLQNLGIFTDNELRSELGREPYPGGNVIWRPANMVPIGEDAYTGDEPPVPKTSRKKFFEIMRLKGYSEDKIDKLSDFYNLK